MSSGTGVTYMIAEIDRMRRDLNLDESVSTLSANYLKQAIELREIDIDSHDRLASTILYITCRQKGAPVVLDEIVEVTRPNVSRKGITRKAKRIQNVLPIEIKLRDAVEFTRQYCQELDLSEDVIEDIVEIAERMEEENILVNNKVGTFAGSVIYAYARIEDLDLVQDDIAKVTNVTTVTIRNNYREVFDVVQRDVPRSVNPPETVADGLKRLEELSSPQASRAEDILESVTLDNTVSVSKGGIAGGGFVVAGRQEDGITDYEKVADTVGVGSETVRKHTKSIAGAYNESDQDQ